jgi:CRP-like cAMP-binding protein
VDYCELYSLDKATFDRVLDAFPEFREHIDRVARERQSSAGPIRAPGSRDEDGD